MNIAEFLFRKTHRNDGPIDEWQGVTVAAHVQLALLYARLGEEVQAVEKTKREISRLQP